MNILSIHNQQSIFLTKKRARYTNKYNKGRTFRNERNKNRLNTFTVHIT